MHSPTWRSCRVSLVEIPLSTYSSLQIRTPSISTLSSSSFKAVTSSLVGIIVLPLYPSHTYGLDVTGYYNQARVLDQFSFNTVTVLPGMPSGDGGRTYPYSGAGVILPIKAPYTDPTTIMICGGATAEKVGLDTCISISPEVPGAQWTTETMVRRVVPCLA
jgi:hypothetical protein